MDGTVRQLLDIKGSHVSTAHVNLSLLECAIMMKSKKIGSLLIVDKGELIGILHEREISRRGVCENKDMESTPVSAIMNREFAVVSPLTSIMDAMAIINTQCVRHLPVLDQGDIVGVISIGDLTHWVLSLQQEDIRHLVDYINGTHQLDDGDDVGF